MSKSKDINYSYFQSLFKNKDKSVGHIISYTLCQTQSIFRYEGLPDSLPQEEFEHLLQTDGHCFVTDVEGQIIALSGTLGGQPDEYGRPTVYTVANVALNLYKQFDIRQDGVLCRNDYEMNGLLPLIGKYAVLLTDSTISLDTAAILSRITMLISASDDKTKQSADEFLKKIKEGDFSVIGNNAFFEGVKMQSAPTTNSQYIAQLIELQQYFKANLLNELGLNANFNMKRERLNTGEVAANVDALLPFVDDMLRQRIGAIKKINDMFGTDITVDLNSAWKTEKENNDKIIETTDTPTDGEMTEENIKEDETSDTSISDETAADTTDGDGETAADTNDDEETITSDDETDTDTDDDGTDDDESSDTPSYGTDDEKQNDVLLQDTDETTERTNSDRHKDELETVRA